MIKEKQVKVKISDEYYKERDNLERFLLQCNLYMWHNQTQFKKINKIMFAVMYMRDKVFQWIQSHLKDILIKESDGQSQVINEMFINFKTFKIHARRMFEDIDAERTAARKLMNLK